MRSSRRTAVMVGLAVLVAALVVWWWRGRGGGAADPVAGSGASRGAAIVMPNAAAADAAVAPEIASPGQVRAAAIHAEAPGGVVRGHVINWSTGEGVEGAELAFIGEAGAVTVHSAAGGVFALTPDAPGSFTLAAASAPGFLPFAPELAHSSVRVATVKDQAVDGVTVFLFPALDYHGRVVNAAGAPIAGAHVKLLGSTAGEQRIVELATEWTSDADGRFVFHAADDAVLEATHDKARGAARVDGTVEITKQLVIVVADGAAPRDAVIAGRVTQTDGAPVAEALVRALPAEFGSGSAATPRATAFATTAADGTFSIPALEHEDYVLTAEADGFAAPPGMVVHASARDVALMLDAGEIIAGTVVTAAGAPVPAYTLLAFRRAGVGRALAAERSIVDPAGAFAVHVRGAAQEPQPDAPCEYELTAFASGWAPTPVMVARCGDRSVKLVVSTGATLRGRVTSAVDGAPVAYARVTREGRGGGASAQPANAGTVTRADGTFELAGIPAGPLSISVGADHFHPRIESGMNAVDGQDLPAAAIALTPLADGEAPVTELVGIGVALAPDGDALLINRVIAGGGAAKAGIVVGDDVISVDGVAAKDLGLDGAIAKIRGLEGTTVSLGVRRGDQTLTLVVERHKLKA